MTLVNFEVCEKKSTSDQHKKKEIPQFDAI